MPPKQKRAQPPSTFRPSAATLSAFQMPREDGEQLAPQISEGAPQPMNATYSAECRAVNSDPHFMPGPAQPVRKEVRPSSGRF